MLSGMCQATIPGNARITSVPGFFGILLLSRMFALRVSLRLAPTRFTVTDFLQQSAVVQATIQGVLCREVIALESVELLSHG